MPRAWLALGSAVLLGLLGLLLLTAGEAPDTTLDANAIPAGEGGSVGGGAEPQPGTARPSLSISTGDAVRARKEAAARATRKTADPHGPYAFLVISSASEAPLEDVEIVGPEEKVLGKTDEDGRLVVEDAGVPLLAFQARKERFVLRSGLAKPTGVTEVTLWPGVTVKGRVVRAVDNTPAVDASVRVWDEDHGAEIASLRTDEQGRFTLRAIRPNHPVTIVVTAEGLVPWVQREFFDTALDDHEIRIGAGGLLTGVVRGPNKEPLADLEVRLPRSRDLLIDVAKGAAAQGEGQARTEIAEACAAVTRTDGRGAYRFRGVPVGISWRPIAFVNARFVVPGQAVRFDDPESTAARDLDVPRPAALRVRVEDDRGAVIGNARLRMFRPDLEIPIYDTDTVEDGWRIIRNLRPTRIEVSAKLPGAPLQRRKTTLVAGSTQSVRLVVPTGRKVIGTVLDKQGKPIRKARVAWGGREGRFDLETRTNEEGEFTLSRLEEESGRLFISARDLPHTSRAYEGHELRDVAPGSPRIVVTLKDGTYITGRFAGLPEGCDVSSEIVPGTASDVRALVWASQEDKRFRRRGPRAGAKAILVFRTRGYPPLLVDERRNPFGSEEVRDLGTLRFEGRNPLKGRIVSGNAGVHGAKVSVDHPWSKKFVRTDRDGDFVLTHMPTGVRHVKLRIEAEGYPKQRAVLGDDAGQFVRKVIRLRHGGHLQVLAVDARGKKPVAGARVEFYPQGGRWTDPVGRTTNAGGRFGIALVEGTYYVSARDSDRKLRAQRTVRVVAHKVTKLVLELWRQRR